MLLGRERWQDHFCASSRKDRCPPCRTVPTGSKKEKKRGPSDSKPPVSKIVPRSTLISRKGDVRVKLSADYGGKNGSASQNEKKIALQKERRHHRASPNSVRRGTQRIRDKAGLEKHDHRNGQERTISRKTEPSPNTKKGEAVLPKGHRTKKATPGHECSVGERHPYTRLLESERLPSTGWARRWKKSSLEKGQVADNLEEKADPTADNRHCARGSWSSAGEMRYRKPKGRGQEKGAANNAHIKSGGRREDKKQSD